MSATGAPLDWEPHTTEVRPWRQRAARGPRPDRQVREITVSLPPMIRGLDHRPDRALAAMTTASAGDLGHLDLVHGRTLKALNRLLLRTEAVDSSKIENVDASLADYGRALLGVGANAAMFSLADALVFRPLDVPRATEIVALSGNDTSVSSNSGFGANRSVSYPDYRDVRDRARSFEGLFAYRVELTGFIARPGEPAQQLLGTGVSGNFFRASGGLAGVFPFTEGAESGTINSLSAGWYSFATGGEGYIDITDDGPHAGGYHLKLGQSQINNGNYETAVLKLDLSGQVSATDLVLDFWALRYEPQFQANYLIVSVSGDASMANLDAGQQARE